ncbi:class I SAM-dependent methyltransferase [Kitasatospora kifunensis]|uniref:SAM-dependent methyltransferase n=1 Tax=Kitasatospora kifunensis TaxID=58351 RepID=A0A7W7R6K3_KITKI|nr:class I SAM-dependent methyltransferase [Kitasatospora kifunensis]MBB4926255.1 SAM-dependent methyltransferase [Kitasatospora kifunensis]
MKHEQQHQHKQHNHAHAHNHGGDDFDWAAMADLLELEGEVHGQYVQQAIAELQRLTAPGDGDGDSDGGGGDRTPRRILDIGSGPGVAACRLAQAFPAAEVTAVDGTAQLLARAEQRAARLGVRVRTRQAEFPAGLAELAAPGTADLIWSGQVVHHVGDQQGVLDALAELLAPGGLLAIVEGGLPTRCLPRDLGFGRPDLFARLDVAMAGRFARMRAELPGSVAVVEDWPALLRGAGLTEVHSRTFLVEHPAPLGDEPRRFVRANLERARQTLGELLDAEDLATLDRLLDPADPACVDRRADLFLLLAKTVHFGRRP